MQTVIVDHKTEPGAMEEKCSQHFYILHLHDSVLFSDVYITFTFRH